MPAGKSGWTQAVRQELREMARPLDEAGEMDLWRCHLWTELEELEMVHLHLSEVTAKQDALAASDTQIQRLQTAPGVGPRLAETVVAVLDDPHRFASVKEVGSYAGLTDRSELGGVAL